MTENWAHSVGSSRFPADWNEALEQAGRATCDAIAKGETRILVELCPPMSPLALLEALIKPIVAQGPRVRLFFDSQRDWEHLGPKLSKRWRSAVSTTYLGNYSAYLAQTAETQAAQLSTYERQQKELAKARAKAQKEMPSSQMVSDSAPSGSLEESPVEAAAEVRAPRIFYSTRTHSQITQVVKELRRTQYRPRTNILASRDHFCIHKTVSKKPNKDEECKRLLDEGSCHL